jgi:xanthine dehydrogenase small subunit
MQTENIIRFILNGAEIRVVDIDPAMTLLQYLREVRQLTGSKEGCAEGDCGACTVVVAEPHQGRIRLRSVNACIQFVAMLHGKALYTVEALKQFADGALHPVQQAMVDYHGSQCGFCTPGFVMSLFALFKTSTRPDREQINDALSGNLCRCTGYRPIIEAAQHMAGYSDSAHWLTQAGTTPQCDVQEQALLDQLTSIQSEQTLHLQQQGRQYFAPASEADLLQLLEQYPQATLVAGNTDVGLWVNKQLRELPVVIALSQISSLQKIAEYDIETDTGELKFGAAVTLSDGFEKLQQYFPQLAEFFARFASQPVRNAGTLVGNIANGSPIGDMPPLLLALSARVVLQSSRGARELALQDFYLGYQQKDLQPGEFVHTLRIPLPEPATAVACYKVSKRHDQDISAVCAAFALTLDEDGRVGRIRIGFGGMAATPARALKTEQALTGEAWNAQAIELATQKLAEDFAPMSDLRASASYRLQVAANLLRRFYLESGRIDSAAVITLGDVVGVPA